MYLNERRGGQKSNAEECSPESAWLRHRIAAAAVPEGRLDGIEPLASGRPISP